MVQDILLEMTLAQLKGQAEAFQLLSKRITEYEKHQDSLPLLLKDTEETRNEQIANLALWFVEEYAKCLE